MKWKKKIESLLHRQVKWQMMLVFVGVAVIPILIIGILSVSTLRSQMKEAQETQLEAEAYRVRALLFDITSSTYSFSEPIVSVQSYRDLLATNEYNAEVKETYNSLTRSLSSLKQSTAAISSISIYTNNPRVPTNTYILYAGSNFDGLEWYEKLEPGAWDSWIWTTAQVNKFQRDEELTLVRRIPIGSEHYSAYLVIHISSNHLRNRILTTDSFIMASLEDFNCIFSSDYKAEEWEMPMTENIRENYYSYLGPYELEGEMVLTKATTFEAYMTSDRFYVLVSDKEAYHQLDRLTGLLVLVLLFAFAGLSVVMLGFTSSFSKRIITLRKAMHQASQGDYDIVDEFRGADELAETFDDLKVMVESVREKEAQYYRSKLEEQRLLNMQREMEFKMLASQINPHFLYNTLEMIRMQAISQKNKTVADSIRLLARSMHYVLENTGTDDTTLEKALDHVKTYLQIQKLRFGDRVNWNFYLDDDVDLEQYRILPLLIQPVVENAIVHGLEGVAENGHISIILEKEKEQILITIRDNGDGMDEERLSQLRKNINKRKKDDSASIGLYNINQRIKARYGVSYGMQIKSERFKGTSVTLVLPAMRTSEENNGEQTD